MSPSLTHLPHASTRGAIDAHAHVFLRDLPMAAGRRYTPGLDAPLDLYLRALDANGLDHGVLVQPSFLGFDNSYMLDALLVAGGRLRGVAVLDATTPGEEFDRLDALGVVGLRFNLVGDEEATDFASPRWRDLLRHVLRKGWLIELHQHARLARESARALIDAGATLVLDHFGLPDPQRGADDPDWRALIALGETDRLWVKLSASYRCGAHGRDVARACVPILFDALGAHHLMWGSDWPHTRFETRQSYADACACLAAIVPDAAERLAVLRAPAELFRFRRRRDT